MLLEVRQADAGDKRTWRGPDELHALFWDLELHRQVRGRLLAPLELSEVRIGPA
jgi:hypothetical protein